MKTHNPDRTPEPRPDKIDRYIGMAIFGTILSAAAGIMFALWGLSGGTPAPSGSAPDTFRAVMESVVKMPPGYRHQLVLDSVVYSDCTRTDAPQEATP